MVEAIEWTDDLQRAATAFRRKGFTWKKVAALVGVSESYLRRNVQVRSKTVFRHHSRPQPWTQEQDDELIRMRGNLLKYEAIGIDLGRTESSIRARARALGLTKAGPIVKSGKKGGRPAIDIAGAKIGEWTVIQRAPHFTTSRARPAFWLCQCSCGTTKPVCGASLRNGTSKSCKPCAQRARWIDYDLRAAFL